MLIAHLVNKKLKNTIMKTLLTIINDPKKTKGLIQYAASMAIDLKASVKLLYVQNSNSTNFASAGATAVAAAQIQRNMEADANSAKITMEKYIEEIKSTMSENVFIDYSIEHGVTSLLANTLISENKADMVVLEGQENESFWTQTRSNMAIIEELNCPVWIVPKAWVYEPFNKIIYASDYKEEDITGLKRLITITQQFSPNITALHITDSIDFEEKVKEAGFIEILQKSTSYNKVSAKVLKESSNREIAELINDYAHLIKANLIVVLKENKSFFEQIFKNSQTKKIINNSMLPVLVFHENK